MLIRICNSEYKRNNAPARTITNYRIRTRQCRVPIHVDTTANNNPFLTRRRSEAIRDPYEPWVNPARRAREVTARRIAGGQLTKTEANAYNREKVKKRRARKTFKLKFPGVPLPDNIRRRNADGDFEADSE